MKYLCTVFLQNLHPAAATEKGESEGRTTAVVKINTEQYPG
jgi:hypothetical protein